MATDAYHRRSLTELECFETIFRDSAFLEREIVRTRGGFALCQSFPVFQRELDGIGGRRFSEYDQQFIAFPSSDDPRLSSQLPLRVVYDNQ